MIKNPEKSKEISELLIKHKANHITKDTFGQSPLFYIAKDGKVELLKLFLSLSIDINETDNFRQTPLFYASREGKMELIKVMLQN